MTELLFVMRKTTRLSLLCLALSWGALSDAQETPKTATLHFYRYKQYQGSALRPSIYCDGIEIVRIPNGRYFDVQLPVGEHTCYANDTQSGATVNFEADKEYYFRTDLQVGFWKGHFRLEYVMPEQGKYDIAKLKPLDKTDTPKPSQPSQPRNVP